MEQFARIEGGVVREIRPSEKPGFVPIPKGVVPGMVVDGDTYVAPLPTLEEAKAALWDAVKQRRFKASAMVMFRGHAYQTDLDSRTNLDGARDLLASGAVSQISWTTAGNVEVVHDAASLEALWLAGAAHIAICFDRAKVLRAEIDAAPDHAALDAINIGVGWPEAPGGGV